MFERQSLSLNVSRLLSIIIFLVLMRILLLSLSLLLYSLLLLYQSLYHFHYRFFISRAHQTDLLPHQTRRFAKDCKIAQRGARRCQMATSLGPGRRRVSPRRPPCLMDAHGSKGKSWWSFWEEGTPAVAGNPYFCY